MVKILLIVLILTSLVGGGVVGLTMMGNEFDMLGDHHHSMHDEDHMYGDCNEYMDEECEYEHYEDCDEFSEECEEHLDEYCEHHYDDRY
ncbi:MAG: hypothetical protein KAJ51_15560 [Thermoplasmata archaeon]|nr:hypothetical protein [Thermoplasmata archaeon]